MYSKIGQLDYRLKLKKTGWVALVLCLNISVDPPNVIKISPCATIISRLQLRHTVHCIFSTRFVGISHSPISMDGYVTCFSGLIQTALYADFFYYYFIRYSTSIPILSVLSFTLSIIIITQAL
uniref:Uncharacterized protein n=1 Tax=Lactuca sativa TaxID=4236 RepID=A0A9R1WUV3_LACSA|nr:hypothetical protein LSAT_V11C900497490 [Lactuca sativa]